MHLTRRTFVAAGLAAVPAVAAAPAFAAPPAAGQRVAGVYQQLTAAGTYINPQFGGVHGLLAFAALVDATGSAAHRQTFESILEWLKRARPPFMSPEVGVQTLHSEFLRSHPVLMHDLRAHVDDLLDTFESNPESLLHDGQIRDLSGRAELLVTYAEFLEQQDLRGTDNARRVQLVNRIDAAATTLLNRLVTLQFTRAEALERLGNVRWTGGFPHVVDAEDGNMGALDVSQWSPAMLSLNQYKSTRALASGFGRYNRASYGRAAAAASRIILASTDADPDLIYAGSPPGFPLDGAEFQIEEEGGEHLYLISYGWSPNAIAEIGATAKLLHEHGVTIPRSANWAENYWVGTPDASVLDPASYRAGLLAKMEHAHEFVHATQLPVPPDFPWINRASYPTLGDDDIRRGGWYDGSGRGTMSASYSQIMLGGYVETGGNDPGLLERAAAWWQQMIVWEDEPAS